MYRQRSINKEGLTKLLYSDHADEKQRNYLNINLLRYLKDYLFNSLSEKERGCIHLYHLENYLIEQALDPTTEESYKGIIYLNQTVKNLLKILYPILDPNLTSGLSTQRYI